MDTTPNAPADLPRSTNILRLLVRNHPGVMSHVCSLFSRRAFNLDAIFCLPQGEGLHSVMLLAVSADGRLDQVTQQLRKLEDVLEVDLAEWGWDAFVAAQRVLARPANTVT